MEHKLLADMDPGRLICIDAEFAAGKYMLELSITDNRGTVIYEQRFKPVDIKSWHTVPHNITPEMVADKPAFKDCIEDIRKILQQADYVMGFALENDIHHMANEGLVLPKGKKIIELRDWFWTLYGRGHGLDYAQGISNQSIAGHLGVDVDEALLHGSAYDTQLTMSAFTKLISVSEEIPADIDSFEKLYRWFKKLYAIKKEEYDRERSAGYCFIRKIPSGFHLKSNREGPGKDNDLIACVKVEDRKMAMIYFSNLFLGKVVDGNFTFARLSAPKLAKFKAYSNTFTTDTQHDSSQLLKLARKFGSR